MSFMSDTYMPEKHGGDALILALRYAFELPAKVTAKPSRSHRLPVLAQYDIVLLYSIVSLRGLDDAQ